MKDTCLTCAGFYAPKGSPRGMGECRLNPPAVTFMAVPAEMVSPLAVPRGGGPVQMAPVPLFGHPPTPADGWCLQHQGRAS